MMQNDDLMKVKTLRRNMHMRFSTRENSVSPGKGLRVLYREHARVINVFILFIIVILLYIIVNAFLDGRFLTWQNINLIITHAVIPCFIAWGMSIGFILNLMDFSVGAILILASNVAGYGAYAFGYPGLFLGAIMAAALLVFVNYNVFVRTKITSWVAGLGLAMLYEAIGASYSKAMLLQGKQVISLENNTRGILNVPYNYILLIVGLVIAYVIFNRLNIGLSIKATGSNSSIAAMMGINTKRTILTAALIAGIFLGMASAINESYGGKVVPTTGLGSIAQLFLPMASFLLAQSLRRIFNITVGIVFAAIFVSSIFTILTMLKLPSGTWQEVALGLIVIICGFIAQRGFKGVVK
jgi:ribose transport system permease protein